MLFFSGWAVVATNSSPHPVSPVASQAPSDRYVVSRVRGPGATRTTRNSGGTRLGRPCANTDSYRRWHLKNRRTCARSAGYTTSPLTGTSAPDENGQRPHRTPPAGASQRALTPTSPAPPAGEPRELLHPPGKPAGVEQ